LLRDPMVRDDAPGTGVGVEIASPAGWVRSLVKENLDDTVGLGSRRSRSSGDAPAPEAHGGPSSTPLVAVSPPLELALTIRHPRGGHG